MTSRRSRARRRRARPPPADEDDRRRVSGYSPKGTRAIRRRARGRATGELGTVRRRARDRSAEEHEATPPKNAKALRRRAPGRAAEECEGDPPQSARSSRSSARGLQLPTPGSAGVRPDAAVLPTASPSLEPRFGAPRAPVPPGGTAVPRSAHARLDPPTPRASTPTHPRARGEWRFSRRTPDSNHAHRGAARRLCGGPGPPRPSVARRASARPGKQASKPEACEAGEAGSDILGRARGGRLAVGGECAPRTTRHPPPCRRSRHPRPPARRRGHNACESRRRARPGDLRPQGRPEWCESGEAWAS